MARAASRPLSTRGCVCTLRSEGVGATAVFRRPTYRGNFVKVTTAALHYAAPVTYISIETARPEPELLKR
eukprot:11182502-Lingulodinium_polyedra.AAC.1